MIIDIATAKPSAESLFVDITIAECISVNAERVQSNLRGLKAEPRLIRIVDPDSGLLEELLVRRVITYQEQAMLAPKTKTTWERSQDLLRLMADHKSPQQCQIFTDVLRLCNQNQVAHYIVQNGSEF